LLKVSSGFGAISTVCFALEAVLRVALNMVDRKPINNYYGTLVNNYFRIGRSDCVELAFFLEVGLIGEEVIQILGTEV
jgi:hypothetical protein